jgi:hypothetical protein
VRKKSFKSLYYELLLSVESKFNGESRHETALRYIREAESMACHESKIGRKIKL